MKQGDLLDLFLFLLVDEGLSGLFSWAMDQQLYTSLRGGSSELVVSHLQYADDIIILADVSIEKLWSINAILHVFELVSGLRVNFSKSSLIGVISIPLSLT